MPAGEKLEYAFVGLTGMILLAAGIVYLFVPQILFDPAGITAGPAGMADLRATYASAQITVALYLFWLIWNKARRPLALPLVFILLTTVSLARGYALVAEQVYSGLMVDALVFEAIFALAALGLLLSRKTTQWV